MKKTWITKNERRTFYKCKRFKLVREAKVTKGEAEKLLIDQWIAMSQQEKLKYGFTENICLKVDYDINIILFVTRC